jgi:protein-disulfide isomerase
MLRIDRRTFLSALTAAAMLGAPALAQGSVSVMDLHAPSALGDKPLGNENAPVTVVEYASMSCPHCGAFHRETFDAFRQKYVDTGQVRFIFREFPLDASAFAAAMVARCAPAERYYEVVDAYFDAQADWLGAQDLYGAMLKIAAPFGFTKESFEACLANQALFEGLSAERTRASQRFGVQATPTFFINGQKHEGALRLEELDAAIQPLL